MLSETQINDNIKAKEQNKKADSKDYENVEIIAAGLLQGEIFQGNVNFQISLDLIQSNINNKIERIEIDFQDGKGFQKYEFKEQLIPYQFKTIGEIALAIKLITKRGTFLTYNILKIHQLERPSPFSGNNEITAKKVIQESSKNGRITDNVVGGEYAIYTGCDNVFDKPIIIAEGFDMGQNVNIDDMVAKYYPYLYAFRNHGYDLVFVNYSNGQDYIQNNAEVLKRVINEVNSRKIGNNKLVVVGESMSGLVARYALRSMENVEQTHNVSHFIAFDTPHQGANVPPGLVALGRRFYQHTGDFTPLVFLLVPEVRAIFSPAARQLLIHQTSSFGKDPLFDSFRQELNNLGNGGYPNQGGIRNIALLNGALDASPNLNYDFGTLNPGDKILDVDVVGILCNSFIDVWTNLIDADFKVYDADAIGICGISLGYERVNFNRNLDRISGGRIRKGLGYGFPIYSTTNPSFSFVPTFSSIDYRGTLNNDNDYTFPISGTIIDAATSQTTNTTLTPFIAIYGQNFTNTEHSFSNQLTGAWNQLAVRENFGITNAEAVLTNCSLPIPPAVMKTGTFFKIGRVNSTLPSSVCKNAPVYKINLPSTIDLIIPNGNQTSNYQQFIRITGGSLTTPRILNVNGWNIATFNYSNLSNGTYTITTVRRFYGTNSQEVTNSTTMRISGSCRIGANDCPEDNEEGDEIGVLTDVNKSCYASKYNGVWVASLENGEFVSRSRLIANGMNVNSANCFAETDPSGGGYPACNCGFILNSVSQNSGQASGNFVFNSCNATKIKWKIMNGSTELYSEEIEPQSATVLFNVPAIVNSGSYQFVVDGVWCTGTTNSLPFNYIKPDGGGGSSLSINQSSWSPSSSANTQSVNVTSNIAWSVSSSDGSWLTASPSSGSNNGSFTISTTANGSTVSRSGTITVSGSGVSSQSVSVSQAGTSGGASICSNISTTNCGNASEGYTHTINIPTAGDYKFKITYASGESNPTGSIIVDSDAAIQFSVGPSTGSWTPASEVFVGTVQKTLSAGNHNIRIAGVNGVSGSNFAHNKLCAVSATGGGGPPSPSCPYTNGQFMTEWLGNEVIRAYICGTKFYAKNDAGYFKSKSWLTGTGRFTAAELACFEEVNPGCGGLRIASSLIETDNGLEVFPNPTNGKIIVSFTLQKDENVWFNLYDTQGKNLQLNDFEGKTGRNEVEFDLQNYASGAYFIDLQYNQKREVRKVMKVN